MSGVRKEVLAEGVELYLGDCREVLPTWGKVDAVVTDPPYGIAYQTNHRTASDKPDILQNDQEAPLWCVLPCSKLINQGGAMYLCTRFDVSPLWMNEITNSGLALKTPIVWDKDNWTAGDLDGDYGNQIELMLFAHQGRHKLRDGRGGNLWRIPRPVAGDHPTPKPVGLMAKAIINSSDLLQLILDPFMGSGTTGVAAVETHRR